MELEETTNLVEGGDTSELDTGTPAEVENEAEVNEPQLDEDGNPIESEPVDDDSEEVERDGVKYKVPKALTKELMMHADYTRKTQEVAEQRKALEAERQTIHQASNDEINARARIVAIDERLAAYSKVDWAAWNDTDPFEAQKGFMEFQQLKDARGQAVGIAGQLAQQRTLAAQQETAKRIEEGRAVLQRDISGWNDELAAALLDTGIKQYGFDRGEIESFEDPRMVKVLHDAHQFHILKAKQQKAQKHVQAQQVTPAAKASGATPKQGLDDRLSIEEWQRRRNEQVRKRA
jgi:Asp-tRNA(Asn)/Glu-tRNA(Gln) amidotransferase A subunit family amidase